MNATLCKMPAQAVSLDSPVHAQAPEDFRRENAAFPFIHMKTKILPLLALLLS